MQGYLGSRLQLERGALGSAVIAGGEERKLITIWFCGNRSVAKGASEDRHPRSSAGGGHRVILGQQLLW